MLQSTASSIRCKSSIWWEKNYEIHYCIHKTCQKNSKLWERSLRSFWVHIETKSILSLKYKTNNNDPDFPIIFDKEKLNY